MVNVRLANARRVEPVRLEELNEVEKAVVFSLAERNKLPWKKIIKDNPAFKMRVKELNDIHADVAKKKDRFDRRELEFFENASWHIRRLNQEIRNPSEHFVTAVTAFDKFIRSIGLKRDAFMKKDYAPPLHLRPQNYKEKERLVLRQVTEGNMGYDIVYRPGIRKLLSAINAVVDDYAQPKDIEKQKVN